MNHLDAEPIKTLTTETHLNASPDAKSYGSPRAVLPMAFFGTNASFSYRVLKMLTGTNLDIRGIFCDSSEPFRPELGFDLRKLDPLPPLGLESGEIRLHLDSTLSTSSILDIGWEKGIPVYSIGRIGSQALADMLRSMDVQVVCVACFNKKIPPSLLRVPKLGFLNLHPSMLPEYRGPEPIQWILHDGGQGGVTIHWMDENWDTGDIAVQHKVDLAPGMSYFVAEDICADAGATAYLEVLVELAQGNVPRTPQGEGGFYRGRLGS